MLVYELWVSIRIKTSHDAAYIRLIFFFKFESANNHLPALELKQKNNWKKGKDKKLNEKKSRIYFLFL